MEKPEWTFGYKNRKKVRIMRMGQWFTLYGRSNICHYKEIIRPGMNIEDVTEVQYTWHKPITTLREFQKAVKYYSLPEE